MNRMGRFLLAANYVCFAVNVIQGLYFIFVGAPALAIMPALLILINFAAIKSLSARLSEKDTTQ